MRAVPCPWHGTAFSALTHGPGQLAMEADHAAWHAEQGGHWHATDHDHHDAADHDHSPTVILPAGASYNRPRRRRSRPRRATRFPAPSETARAAHRD